MVVWETTAVSSINVNNGNEWLPEALIEGLKRKKFSTLTPIQAFAGPLILEGKDCILQSSTGSGKTLAYLLPIFASLLQSKSSVQDDAKQKWNEVLRACILAPTKELVAQIKQLMDAITFHCYDILVTEALAEKPSSLRELIAKRSAVIVAQPAALLACCKLLYTDIKKAAKTATEIILFPNLQHVVLDEADLILHTFGYHEETLELFRPSPKKWGGHAVVALPSCTLRQRGSLRTSTKAQVILTSATLNLELQELRDLALYQPIIICLTNSETPPTAAWNLEEDETIMKLAHVYLPQDHEQSKESKLEHFISPINRQKNEDLLILLGLLRKRFFNQYSNAPKVLVFVKSEDQAYRVHLFLKAFQYKSGVCVPTQALSRRLQQINRFNQRVIEILVVCDSLMKLLDSTPPAEIENKANVLSVGKKKKRRREEDPQSSFSRGLNYAHLTAVVNFDTATSAEDFEHKVGRAAREALAQGVSITFNDTSKKEPSVVEMVRQ